MGEPQEFSTGPASGLTEHPSPDATGSNAVVTLTDVRLSTRLLRGKQRRRHHQGEHCRQHQLMAADPRPRPKPPKWAVERQGSRETGSCHHQDESVIQVYS